MYELPEIFRLKLAPQPQLWCIPCLFLYFSLSFFHIQEVHYLLIRPSTLYDCWQDFILPYRIPLVQKLFQNCGCMVISFLRCDHIRFHFVKRTFAIRFSTCSWTQSLRDLSVGAFNSHWQKHPPHLLLSAPHTWSGGMLICVQSFHPGLDLLLFTVSFSVTVINMKVPFFRVSLA